MARDLSKSHAQQPLCQGEGPSHHTLFHNVAEVFAKRGDVVWSSDYLGKNSTSFPICLFCEPAIKAVCKPLLMLQWL